MVGSARAAVEMAPERASWTPADLVQDLLDRDAAGGWVTSREGMWRLARPAGRPLRAQGWKLHLSATPLSIVDTLSRAVPVLVAERCAFKFAADADTVEWLNSRRCPRGTAGKTVTAYPADDDQFRQLAALLHRATAGLAGPAILSDRRYRPGSLVHYRFGGFRPVTVLDDDGCHRPVIVAPDGELVEDRRDAWYAPPAWAPPPWPDGPAEPTGEPGPVLLGDRFVVLEAMRHSSRGGIFRAYDRRTGATVVVKQARAHMEVDPAGQDCRDRLRHEAHLYERLAPAGLAPRLVATVSEGDDLFLAREMVEGTTLRAWVTAQAPAGGVPPDAGVAMVARLVRLVAAVHRTGLALVDVSPNNFVVDPAGEPHLIDPDSACEIARPVHPVGTPGYTPPEHRRRGLVVARPAADLFGVGGVAFLIAVGTDPVLASDDPPERTTQTRLSAWLAEVAPDLPLARRLAAPILGLTHPDPARRWSLARVGRHLAAPAERSGGRLRPAGPAPDPDRLIEDAAGWLRATMTPTGDRLWPAGRSGATADPCAVQHGAAGGLAALVAAAGHVADPAPVRAAVAVACGWIERRLPAEPRLLPGLWFGRSGTAWALYDAARLLGDEGLAGRALDLAARVPVRWPNPDVAHGVAGAGLAQLHLALATGDPRFLPRVRACADALVAAAQRTGGHVTWPIPATLRSALAGQTHLGHAHGTAGIGGFLLAAGVATGDARYLGLAAEAAETLADTAVRQGPTAFWPARPGAEELTGAGWCAGAAGIGAFLLRAGEVLADPRLPELVGAAAAAIHRDRSRTNPAVCHGLAGGGHFLLDLADAGDPAGHRGAEDLTRLLAVRAVRRGGRLLVPDETGSAVTADHGTGLAGALTFLVRLRHGGPAPWTVRPTPVPAARGGGEQHPTLRRDPS